MIIEKTQIDSLPMIAEGGEGKIYRFNGDLIKIYKSNIDKKDKYRRLTSIMSKNLPKNIVKPKELIFDENNKFIGFSMLEIKGEEIKKFTNKKYCKINNISIKDILNVLIQIKDTLKIIHAQNIFISDLNEKNILINENNEVFFIDVDSWSIDGLKSFVCMESFKDPNMKKNDFSRETDIYSFSILSFKLLTRLHPFGGTTNPYLSLVERMKQKISVLDRTEIMIPSLLIRDWRCNSPSLLKALKTNFETDRRYFFDSELDEMFNNLIYCNKHNDYYYNKYLDCPICNSGLSCLLKPEKETFFQEIPFTCLINLVQTAISIIDTNIYYDKNGDIAHFNSNITIHPQKGYKYFFSNNGSLLIKTNKDKIWIHNYTTNKEFSFNKSYNTEIFVLNDDIFFINESLDLIMLKIECTGNSMKKICKVSFNHFIEIEDEKNFFIINSYDNKKILNISGYMLEYTDTSVVVNYGIHFDSITSKWLFIIENEDGNFTTRIIDKNKIVYETNNIRYSTPLNNICFSNNTIYKATNGKIVGYNYLKNIIKEFNCSIVNEETKLIKKETFFIAINEKEIFKIGK